MRNSHRWIRRLRNSNKLLMERLMIWIMKYQWCEEKLSSSVIGREQSKRKFFNSRTWGYAMKLWCSWVESQAIRTSLITKWAMWSGTKSNDLLKWIVIDQKWISIENIDLIEIIISSLIHWPWVLVANSRLKILKVKIFIVTIWGIICDSYLH